MHILVLIELFIAEKLCHKLTWLNLYLLVSHRPAGLRVPGYPFQVYYTLLKLDSVGARTKLLWSQYYWLLHLSQQTYWLEAGSTLDS